MTDTELNAGFWQSRYETGTTGWDLGEVSPPLKSFFDTLPDKGISILIPGAGNAWEAEYLHSHGFADVHVLDIAPAPLENIRRRIPAFPENHLHLGDFFDWSQTYDLIVEQTFFCAIDPALRPAYVDQMHRLLKPGGMLAGVLFNRDFEGGPPFGGHADEYRKLFGAVFTELSIEPCLNSAAPRAGSEVFLRAVR